MSKHRNFYRLEATVQKKDLPDFFKAVSGLIWKVHNAGDIDADLDFLFTAVEGGVEKITIHLWTDAPKETWASWLSESGFFFLVHE